MENLTTVGESGKPQSPKEIPQIPAPSQAPQGRPRWQVITELKRMARKTSTEFWAWYWGLDEADKRTARAG